jgi:hypothetical protein
MRYRCWDVDANFGERDIEAMTARDAACEYARRFFGGGDPFDSIDVWVSRRNSGAMCFTVDVDFDPSFSAMPCKQPAPRDPGEEK